MVEEVLVASAVLEASVREEEEEENALVAEEVILSALSNSLPDRNRFLMPNVFAGFRGEGRGRGGRGRGRGEGGRGRQFDRHSGSDRSGVKPTEKREGFGSHNWGTQADELSGETEQQRPAPGEEHVGEGEERGEFR